MAASQLMIVSRLRALILSLVLWFTAANLPAAPAPEPENAEFRALVEKTNLYLKALNALASVQRSYDRYTSWVDLKKGFTGKERYISYGLYELNSSSVDDVRQAAQKGPEMKPPLPELDAVLPKISDTVVALAPLVKRASDYFEQEDYKDDGGKLGKELHMQMMPLFERTFAAEAELRRGLDKIKAELDQQQLAEVEKVSGRKYEWHLRSYMIAAKLMVAMIPESPEAPPLSADAFKARYTELENAYNAFASFTSEHPEEVKKVMMASFAESAVKEFFTASKFLRRTLEAPKLDRREYIERVGNLAKSYNDLIQRTNGLR